MYSKPIKPHTSPWRPAWPVARGKLISPILKSIHIFVKAISLSVISNCLMLRFEFKRIITIVPPSVIILQILVLMSYQVNLIVLWLSKSYDGVCQMCLSLVFLLSYLEFMTRNTNNISWRHRDKWHWPIDGLMLSPSLWLCSGCWALIGWHPPVQASDWPPMTRCHPPAWCWSGMPGLVPTDTPATCTGAHSSETLPGPQGRGGGGPEYANANEQFYTTRIYIMPLSLYSSGHYGVW